MTNAITPEEAVNYQDGRIPDFVIDAVNSVIKAKIVGGRLTVKQDEIMEAVLAHPDCPTKDRQEVFGNHWLDFEKIYRAAGWEIDYDKPAYNESYPALFTFVAPKPLRKSN